MASNCAFCGPLDPLFETDYVRVIADQFPMVAGHTLIISKTHRRCYGDADPSIWTELDDARLRVGQILSHLYRLPVIVFENGIAGQSVSHAHLHVIPMNIPKLPAGVLNHSDLQRVSSWVEVAAYFRQHSNYRYIEVGELRGVIPGHGSLVRTLRGLIGDATGLRLGTDGAWIKTTDGSDVAQLQAMWPSSRRISCEGVSVGRSPSSTR